MVTESEKSKHDMLRAMRKHIRENGINAIEKFIADWNGRADANRWKHAAQPDDNIWDNELK